MKVTRSILLSGAIALATCATAYAQPIDVRVVGTVTPAACVPTIGGGGVVNYGSIAASSLNASSRTLLSEHNISFAIACDSPTKVAIRTVDNRSDGVVEGITAGLVSTAYPDEHNFGLGTSSGAKIGGYVMKLQPASFTADGAPAFPIFTEDAGQTWRSASAGALRKGSDNLRSWASTVGGDPMSFQHLSGTLSVQAALNKADALPLSDEIALDGLATLEMVYL